MAVYDDEKEKTNLPGGSDGSHDDLGKNPAERAGEIRDLEKSYAGGFGSGAGIGKKDSAKESSPGQLKAAEGKPAGGPSDGAEEAAPFSFKNVGKRLWRGRGSGSRRRRNIFLLAGGAGGLGVIGIMLAIFFFLSSLKAVHFSTVLRSTGFAAFNLAMKKEFARTIFDAAVLTDESTGTFKLKDRSLLDRLRGVNPEKQLTELGRDNTLKFDFEGGSKWGGLKTTNDFKGVELNGEKINLDDLAQKSFGKNYNELGIRESWTVESQFTSTVREGLAERLALEGRSFRSGIYDGLRQAAGIRMWKWVEAAKDYAGKPPDEARAKDVDESVQEIDEGGKTGSGLEEVDKEAQDARDQTTEAAKTGESPPEIRSKLAEQAKGLSEVSDAVLLTTGYCILHDLQNSFSANDSSREQRVARFGHDNLTAADQVKQGDVVGEAVGAENARWDGSENAALYKEATGEPLNNTEDQQQLAAIPPVTPPWSPYKGLLDTLNNAANSIIPGRGLISHIPLLNKLNSKVEDVGCNVAMNQYVQGGFAIGEIFLIFTGEKELSGTVRASLSAAQNLGKAGGTFVIGDILGRFIDNAVRSHAGLDYSGTATGTDLYNQSAVAVDYIQQTGTRQISYGRPLSTQESSSVQAVAMDDMRNQYSHQSASQRYFAADNPFSLVGHMAALMPSTQTQFFSSIQSGLMGFVASGLGIFQKSFAMLSNTLLPHSYAFADTVNSRAQHDNYGVDQWGWSNDEQNRIDTDPSFSPQKLATFVEPRYDELNKKYSQCYSYVLQKDKPGDCNGLLSPGSKNYDEALKWRAYMAESYAADHLGQSLTDPSTQ